jgi:diaminopimelate epimerase
MVQRICHRQEGIGSDGILEVWASEKADLGVRIWNPDGSIAEKSGNGLRILAWWAHHRASFGTELSVDTGFDVVQCLVKPSEGLVKIEMGTATFIPEQIPCREKLWGTEKQIGTRMLPLWAVSMGNPHCVSFFSADTGLDSLDWRVWGKELEVSPLFPNRTNVQFAKVLNRSRIEIRIWERGAGETSASGSSSCAVAAIARKMGWVDSLVTMVMPGGELSVEIMNDFQVILEGPVTEIGTMEWFGA